MITLDPKRAMAVTAAGQPSMVTLRCVFLMSVGMLSATWMSLFSMVEPSLRFEIVCNFHDLILVRLISDR